MQNALFHESLQDAIGSVVSILGGAKVVGAQLWPEKSPDEAGRLLRHCLNAERAEKLSLEQIVWLLREARKRGAHDAMHFLARECGYQDPAPLEPEDERAALMRQFVEAQSALQALAKRMERAGILRAVG